MNTNMIKKLAVTWRLCGGVELDQPTQEALVAVLDEYAPNAVSVALDKCLRECRGRITIGDVTSRIDDGRPGANEAWAQIPIGESDAVVWSDEMAQAYGIAGAVMVTDRIAGRVAFIEAYERLCAAARHCKTAVNWTFSPGRSHAANEAALTKAVNLGRFTAAEARRLEPGLSRLPGEQAAKQIESHAERDVDDYVDELVDKKSI